MTSTIVSGENICIDYGMTKLIFYHGDNGMELSYMSIIQKRMSRIIDYTVMALLDLIMP